MAKTTIQIKNCWNSNILFEYETEDNSLQKTLEEAVRRKIDLRGAYLRGAYLRGAYLRGAVLRGADLRGAVLSGAVLRGAVLSGADLRGADLRDAVLSGAYLRGAVLSDAVLSGWIPKIENIHQRILRAASAENALDMGNWHGGDANFCGTTHCRAGWATNLAGEGGRVLEGMLGTPVAAALIYQASDPQLAKVPDFYCNNEEALSDMKRLADEEREKA